MERAREVIVIKSKLMLIAVTLLFVAVLVTPIVGLSNAGKGQEKLFFQINVVTANEPVPDRIIRCAPVWETIPLTGGDANVVFVEIEYLASDLSVAVGNDIIAPSDVALTDGTVDVTVYWNVEVPYSKVIDKDTFTLDFSEYFGAPATIEVSRIGMSNQATGESSGTFVGHGLGYLEDVKVSGKQTAFAGGLMSQSFQLTGTIMGWP